MAYTRRIAVSFGKQQYYLLQQTRHGDGTKVVQMYATLVMEYLEEKNLEFVLIHVRKLQKLLERFLKWINNIYE